MDQLTWNDVTKIVNKSKNTLVSKNTPLTSSVSLSEKPNSCIVFIEVSAISINLIFPIFETSNATSKGNFVDVELTGYKMLMSIFAYKILDLPIVL